MTPLFIRTLVVFLLAAGIIACAGPPAPVGRVSFAPAESPTESPPPAEIEELSHLAGMADDMARDILAALNPPGQSAPTPLILVDAERFLCRDADHTDKKHLVDRLRRNLNRAADGRLTFLGPGYFQVLEKQRESAKDAAREKDAPTPAGCAAYRLEGSVALFDTHIPETGEKAVLYRFAVELIQAESGETVWRGAYAFREKPAESAALP